MSASPSASIMIIFIIESCTIAKSKSDESDNDLKTVGTGQRDTAEVRNLSERGSPKP